MAEDHKDKDERLQCHTLRFHRAFSQARGLFVAIEKHGEALLSNDDAAAGGNIMDDEADRMDDEADRCLGLGAAGKELLERLVCHHVEIIERYEQLLYEQRVDGEAMLTNDGGGNIDDADRQAPGSVARRDTGS